MATKKVSFRIPEEKLKSINHLIRIKVFKDRTAFFLAATEHYLEQLDGAEMMRLRKKLLSKGNRGEGLNAQ